MKSAPNLVLAIITGVVVIVAILSAIFASRDTGPDWPDDSPESVVQTYVQAVIDQNYAQAITHLDPDLACTPEDFAQAYYPQDTAMSLLQAHIGPDNATVAVEFGSYSEAFSDPFIGREQFELIPHETDGWLITGSPWPLYSCAGTP